MKTKSLLIAGVALLTIHPYDKKVAPTTTSELITFVSPEDRTPGQLAYAVITYLWEKSKISTEVLQNHINSLSLDTSEIKITELKVFDTDYKEIKNAADNILDVFNTSIMDKKQIKELKPKKATA